MSDVSRIDRRNPGGLSARRVIAMFFPTVEGWNWTIGFERKWQDAWVGAHWRSLSSIAYEIDPRFPVVTSKRGTHYQRTNFDLWVCIVPFFPLHLMAWRPRMTDESEDHHG